MTEETGCGLLLDVNNVYVSAFNNDFDPVHYIKQLPHNHIVQMHIAGHQHFGDHIIDTHDSKVANEVWQLFNLAWQLTGGVSTLLEWDSQIPEFEIYHAELLKAKEYMHAISKPAVHEKTQTREEKTVSTPIDFLVTEMLIGEKK
jgi:uncharacterized protein (UPF0276 family)